MRRDVAQLESEQFDLLVVGGGIHGAAVVWDASLRGLRAALIEQRDFCAGTTGNSLRIAHGGLRAIQQLAVRRLRQSAREQAILFRIAPSLVQPLPCLIPIYRNSAPSVSAFRSAFAASRLLTADINRGFKLPLPPPRVVSAEEAKSCFHGFESSDLVGGALWYDAQVPDIERLVLAFLRSASDLGAAPVNYVRARRLVVENGRVAGIEASDQRTGRTFRVRAGVVVNAAGPWVGEIAESLGTEISRELPSQWAQGVNLVVDRPPPPVAIGIRSPWGAERDPIIGGNRYLFLTGWKGATLAGTSYRPTDGNGFSVQVQVGELVEELNAACPALKLGASEVSQHHCGRIPLRSGLQAGRPTALLDQGQIVEHGKHGLDGFISVVGTKFTTARHLAETAVDAVLRSLGRAHQPAITGEARLVEDPAQGANLALRVRQAIREEMALSLEDVVVRRMGLGLTRCPSVEVIGQIADTAAAEWGWSVRQTDEEITQLLGRFLPSGATMAA